VGVGVERSLARGHPASATATVWGKAGAGNCLTAPFPCDTVSAAQSTQGTSTLLGAHIRLPPCQGQGIASEKTGVCVAWRRHRGAGILGAPTRASGKDRGELFARVTTWVAKPMLGLSFPCVSRNPDNSGNIRKSHSEFVKDEFTVATARERLANIGESSKCPKRAALRTLIPPQTERPRHAAARGARKMMIPSPDARCQMPDAPRSTPRHRSSTTLTDLRRGPSAVPHRLRPATLASSLGPPKNFLRRLAGRASLLCVPLKGARSEGGGPPPSQSQLSERTVKSPLSCPQQRRACYMSSMEASRWEPGDPMPPLSKPHPTCPHAFLAQARQARSRAKRAHLPRPRSEGPW